MLTKGLNQATETSSMGVGREGAICEIMIVMQISPVRANEGRAYSCVAEIWQGSDVVPAKAGTHTLRRSDTESISSGSHLPNGYWILPFRATA